MVDTSDFTIAYCPTNIYSVGTPHEIIVSRLEHKPVLFVSPPVVFPALTELKTHLSKDKVALDLLSTLEAQIPIKQNPRGIPSLWYMPLIGEEHFFDGFGFSLYREDYEWELGPMDERENVNPPKRPLLKYLEDLSEKIPKKWDSKTKQYVRDDNWLLWDLDESARPGSQVSGPHRKD